MAETSSPAAGQDLAPLERMLPPAYPETLRELATVLYLELCQQLGPLAAQLPPAQLAFALTERLSSDLGGGNLYIQKAVSYRLSLRDEEILARLTKYNRAQLAREYGLTEMRLRQIETAKRRELFAARQGKLEI